MKRFLTALLILALTFSTLGLGTTTTNAAMKPETQIEIVLLENGDYLETTIDDTPNLSGISLLSVSQTITKTKTVRYKNESGDTLEAAEKVLDIAISN